MEESRIERLEYTLCFLVMGLIPLHLYLDLFNLTHGIDKGYGHSFPLLSYILIGVYLLIVLLHFALDRLTEISFLCLLYAPFMVLVPLLELLGVSVYGHTSLFSVAAVGGFCLLNWAICRFWVGKA